MLDVLVIVLISYHFIYIQSNFYTPNFPALVRGIEALYAITPLVRLKKKKVYLHKIDR